MKFSTCVFLASIFSHLCSWSQSGKVNSTLKLLDLTVANKEIEYEESTALTNVLKIVNNSKKLGVVLTLDIRSPEGWKVVNQKNKEYSVLAGDSLFVPVRIIPQKTKPKSGINYVINIVATELNTRQLFHASFHIYRKQWNQVSMALVPGQNVYLKNEENQAKFHLNLFNETDQNQPLILNIKSTGKEFQINDSAGYLTGKSYQLLYLKPNADSSIAFNALSEKAQRNFRRIDNYSFIFDDYKSRQSNIYFSITKIKGARKKIDSLSSSDDFFISKAVKIHKLSSRQKVNPYDVSCLPLTYISNLSFFRTQVVSNQMFFGNFSPSQNSFYSYYLQGSFYDYTLAKSNLRSINGSLAHVGQKFNYKIGNSISLNMPFLRMRGIGGLGASLLYKISNGNSVGMAITRLPANTGKVGYNYAIGYSGKLNKVNYGIGYDYNNSVNLKINTVSAGVRYRNSKQAINFQFGIDNLKNKFINTYGEFFNANYQVNNLNWIKTSSLNYTFQRTPTNMQTSTKDSLIFANLHNSSLQNLFSFKRFKNDIMTMHMCQILDGLDNNKKYTSNVLLTNSLSFINKKNKLKSSFVPGLFSNYSNNYNQILFSNGGMLGYSFSDFERNLRMGANVSVGVNEIINIKKAPIFLSGKFNLLVNYRVWNMSANYQFGPYMQGDYSQLLTLDKLTQQNFYFRLSNQHQFKNRQLLLENNLVYSFLSYNNRSSFNLYSQLFYYSENLWRFDISMNWSYIASALNRYSYMPSSLNSVYPENKVSNVSQVNYVIGVGLKKDFCIQNQRRKKPTKMCNIKIKTFLDVNGNLKHDIQDLPLENVVIGLNQFETQTDKQGLVSYNNLLKARYKLKVFSLEDVGSWFPHYDDSVSIFSSDTIYVPFIQGIEVNGNVILERDKFSVELKGDLDVSRIRITLSDSLGNLYTSLTDSKGYFKFYVPKNSYVLKFDENILGQSFELVENEIPVNFDSESDKYFYSFHVTERRRNVTSKKFSSTGEQIDTRLTKVYKDDRTIKLKYLDSLTAIINKNLITPIENSKFIKSVEVQADKLSDEMKIGFSVKLDELKTLQVPEGKLAQLIRLNLVDSIVMNDGSKQYYIGFFKSIIEAQKLVGELKTKGIQKAKIIVKDKTNE